MVKRQYQIMIAVGAAKSCGLYEVWSMSQAPAYGSAWCADDFVHHGYFQSRAEAQEYIDRRIDQDCPSNSCQATGE